MRRLPMIPDPSITAQIIHQSEFVFYTKSLGRLSIAAIAVSLFSMTYLPLSDDIMMYDSRLNNFKVHMDAIKDKKKNDTNDPPKLYRNLPIEEYIEGIYFYLVGKIGAMNCPISWETRENMLSPAASSPIAHNQTYPIEHG